jgi:hypothetical protein
MTDTLYGPSWMGHKRIDETMIYVHVAEHHRREIPEASATGALSETDPNRRILAMLSARGNELPRTEEPKRKRLPKQPLKWWR